MDPEAPVKCCATGHPMTCNSTDRDLTFSCTAAFNLQQDLAVMDVDERMKDAEGNPGVKMEPEAGDATCPITKNAEMLEELDIAEEKVAELLEVAATALDELAGVECLNSAKVDESTKQFLGLVSAVHGILSSKASLIRDYTPYSRSIYGPRKELELLEEKARFLRAALSSASREPLVEPLVDATAAATPSPSMDEAAGKPGLSEDVGVDSSLPESEGGGPVAVAVRAAAAATAAKQRGLLEPL